MYKNKFSPLDNQSVVTPWALTISWLPHPCSSDSKIRTCVAGSSLVAGHPPSVRSVTWTGLPVPSRSFLASTRTEFSRQMTMMLSAAVGVFSSKFGGNRGSSSAGGSGNLQDNGWWRDCFSWRESRSMENNVTFWKLIWCFEMWTFNPGDTRAAKLLVWTVNIFLSCGTGSTTQTCHITHKETYEKGFKDISTHKAWKGEDKIGDGVVLVKGLQTLEHRQHFWLTKYTQHLQSEAVGIFSYSWFKTCSGRWTRKQWIDGPTEMQDLSSL